MPLQCYFECTDDGKLYSFPKNEERFNAWRAILHPLAEEYSKEYISRHFRLCYRHFKDCYILTSQRLTINAIPTINLVQYGGDAKSVENISMEDVNKFGEGNSISKTLPPIERNKEDISNSEPLITKDIVEVSDDENVSKYEKDRNKFEKEESVTKSRLQNKEQGTDTNNYAHHYITSHVHVKSQRSEEINRRCLNLRLVLENSNANLIRSYWRKGYTCFFCSNYYKDPAKLKEHSLGDHKSINEAELEMYVKNATSKLDITILRCNLCNNNIDTLKNLIVHLKEIHEKNVFVDEVNRILPIKFVSDVVQCDVCSEVFQRFRMLLSHYLQTHCRNYICNECDRGFINKSLLQNHILERHEKLVHSHLGMCKIDLVEKRFKHSPEKEQYGLKHPNTHSTGITIDVETAEFNQYTRSRKVYRLPSSGEDTDTSVHNVFTGDNVHRSWESTTSGEAEITESEDKDISDVTEYGDDFEMVVIKDEKLDKNENLQAVVVKVEETVNHTSEESLEVMVKVEEIEERDKHIHNLKTILECTNATLIRSNENDCYTCFFCEKCFQDPSKLKQHAINTHMVVVKNDLKNIDEGYVAKLDVTKLYCKLCYRYIDTLQNLDDHLNKVHDIKLFDDIKNQVVPLIFNKGVPICCVCFRSWDSYRGLMLHLLVHYKKYLWTKCDSSFIDMGMLHNNFPCSYCPKIFHDKLRKKGHENESHKDKLLKFRCEECNENFGFYMQKKLHLLKAHNIKMTNKSVSVPSEPVDAPNKTLNTSNTFIEIPIEFDDSTSKRVDSIGKQENTNSLDTKDDLVMIEIDMQMPYKPDDSSMTPGELEIKDQDKYKHFHNIKTILECTNATLIWSLEDAGYTCYFCNKCYKIPSKLKEHASNIHTTISEENLTNLEVADFVFKLDVTDLYCKLCYRYIDTLQYLTDHMNEHGKKIFVDIKTQVVPLKFQKCVPTCCVCLKTCSDYHELVEHLLIHYSHYVSKKHDSGLITTEILHVRVHGVGSFPCRLCPRTFDNAMNKADHEIKVHHYEFFKYKCETCGERFQFVKQKNLHLLEVHNIRNMNKKYKFSNKALHRTNFFHSTNTLIHLDKSINSLDTEMATECEAELSDEEEQRIDNMDFGAQVETNKSQNICNQINISTNKTAADDIIEYEDVVELSDDNGEDKSDNNSKLKTSISLNKREKTNEYFDNAIRHVKKMSNDSISKCTIQHIDIGDSLDDKKKRKDKRAYYSQVHSLTTDCKEEDKHFNNIKAILDCTNATLIRSREELGYTCLFCYKFHKTLPDLKKHALNIHRNLEKINFAHIYVASYVAKLDITGLKCRLCSAEIDTIKNLFKHLTEIHTKTLHIELWKQILPLKLNSGLLECCVCFQNFKKFQYLLYHMQKHYKNYACIKCDKGFNKRSELLSHSRSCVDQTAKDEK